MTTHPVKSVHVLSDDFQWLTPKHIEAVEKAASNSDIIMFLVADADVHRSIVAPFTFEERSELIKAAFSDLWNDDRIRIVDVPSQLYVTTPYPYALQAIDEELEHLLDSPAQTEKDIPVTVQGHQMVVAEQVKPEWAYVADEIKDLDEQITALDNYILSDEPTGYGTAHSELLDAFKRTEEFAELQHECNDKHFILNNFGKGPFYTADAICTIGDKVLLISRKNPPYRHTLATPGGLLDPNEDPLMAAVRELLEETEMRVPAYVLAGDTPTDDAKWVPVTEDFLKSRVMNTVPREFASKTRDPRGDYRANVFWFDLSDLPVTPKVKGMDDAEKANWASKNGLTTSSMAFDHFAGLCAMGVTEYPATVQEARLKNEVTVAPTL